MIHLGKNTTSRIISKGIAAGKSNNTYRGLVTAHRKATGARNFTNCDSLLIGDQCGAHTVPYIEAKNSSAVFEHEATTSKISEDMLFYCRAARHVGGRGDRAGGQRLRQGRAAAAADGIRGRGAEADFDLAGRQRGMTEKPVINIDDVPLADRGNGKSFAVKWGRVGPALGLNALGCAVHVVPPGKKAFPFHRHHVMDELFFILSGEGQYRWGDETLPIKTGDLVSAPAGSKAHQLINTGNGELRYLGISSAAATEVVDYPDSGKIGVMAGVKNGDFRSATYAGMGRMEKADYFDGEDKVE